MKRENHCTVTLTVMLTLLASGRLFAQPEPVGQLLEVQGTVVQKHPNQTWKPLQSFDQFKVGDELKVKPKSSAVLILYESGARFAAVAGSVLKVEHLQVRCLSGPPLRTLPSVSMHLLKRTSTPGAGLGPIPLGVLLRSFHDPETSPSQLSPVGAVRTTTVTLLWERQTRLADSTGAGGQRVKIKDDQTHKTVFTQDLELSARSCVVEQGQLYAGHWYTWTVTAAGKGIGVQQTSAPLYVLNASEVAEVEAIETEAGEVDAKNATLQFLMARSYERFGLLTDARMAYESALRMAPGNTATRNSLTRLRKLTGLGE